MRDLRNPLAPSIFKGEGRKRRQAKRTAKIASNNKKIEANKNKTNTGNTGNTGGKVNPSSTSSAFTLKNGMEITMGNADFVNKQNQKEKDKSSKRSAKDLELCQDGKCTKKRQERQEKRGARKAKQKARGDQKTLKNFGTKRTINKKRLVQSKETKENNKLRKQNKRLEERSKRKAPKIRSQEKRQKEREAKKNTRNAKKKTSEMGPFITQKQRRILKKK